MLARYFVDVAPLAIDAMALMPRTYVKYMLMLDMPRALSDTRRLITR